MNHNTVSILGILLLPATVIRAQDLEDYRRARAGFRENCMDPQATDFILDREIAMARLQLKGERPAPAAPARHPVVKPPATPPRPVRAMPVPPEPPVKEASVRKGLAILMCAAAVMGAWLALPIALAGGLILALHLGGIAALGIGGFFLHPTHFGAGKLKW
jgi:hypothetical protein